MEQMMPIPREDRRWRWKWVLDIQFVLLVSTLVLALVIPMLTRVSFESRPDNEADVLDFNVRVEFRVPEAPLSVDLRKQGEEEKFIIGE